MIQSLEVDNFQSHKHTELVFHKGVNVIVGPSDSGKSAVLRSLKYLLFSKPTGDAFRSKWGGDTKVKVVIDNHTVSRIKAKDNMYVLDGSEFKAVKSDVPKEIQDVLNVSDLNLQQQIDGPFLINKTPGEVAKFFNHIANFDKIDLSISNIKKWVGQKTATLSVKEQDLVVSTEKLRSFEYLGQFEADLQDVEKLQQQLDLQETEYAALFDLTTTIQEVDAELTVYNELLKSEAEVDKILALINKRDQIEWDLEDMQLAVDTIKKTEAKLVTFDKLLQLESLIAEIDTISAKYAKQLVIYDELQDLITSIHAVQVEIEETDLHYEKLHSEFEANMPDVCSFCHQLVEKWKPIKGYEGVYEISNYGNVRSYYTSHKTVEKTAKLKTLSLDKDGYLRVTLYDVKNGKSPVNKGAHRLVLETFISECPEGMEGSHLDGNRTNNRLENLLWETHFDNEHRKELHGTYHVRGTKVLDELQVSEIIELYAAGGISHRKLAEKYNVCEDTIRKVINGNLWKNL